MIGRRAGSYVAKRIFFSSAFNNHALAKPLNHYVKKFRDPNHILNTIGMNGISSQLTLQDFLEQLPFNSAKLNFSPIQLVDAPISPDASQKLLTITDLTIKPSQEIVRAKLIEYIPMLFRVMKNEYSKRNYELALEDRENVSEGEHGKQAEKISRELGMPCSYVVQQRFHDISRCTHENVAYCNKHHHDESHRIILPLLPRKYGFNPSYSRIHTFGKYLLTECCDPYREELMSPLSSQSLMVQKKQFSEILVFLRQLNPEDALRHCLEWMLGRLIDDSSKVPSYLLKGDPAKRYYSDEITLSSVINLLNEVLQNLSPSQFDEYLKDLDAALKLLHRPEVQKINVSKVIF